MPKTKLRLVEEELAADPRLRLVAFMSQMVLEDYECSKGGYKQSAKWWKRIFQQLTKCDDWKDGKHMGDCTKEPNTCIRCMVEEMVDDAAKILKVYDSHFEGSK
jgi:hypothetical protein